MPVETPTAQEAALIAEELALLEKVQGALSHTPHDARLPDPRAPYVAHLRIRTGGRVRDVLLGPASFISSSEGVAVVDWSRAAMSRVYFSYAEGDSYEEEVEDRVLEGEVLHRCAVTVEAGTLLAIRLEHRLLAREGETWTARSIGPPPLSLDSERARAPLLATAGTHGNAALDALLDPDQRRALHHPGRGPLLVLGAAGSGKTTVAVHRLGYLHARSPKRFRARELGVVVPEPGLLRVIRRAFDVLGLEEAATLTYDAWVLAQARRAFPGARWRLAEDTPARVLRFKRHVAMRAAIGAYLQAQEEELSARLDRALIAGGAFSALLAGTRGAHLGERLDRAVRTWSARPGSLSEGEVRRLTDLELRRMEAGPGDLVGLLGDRAHLQRAVDASGGDLSAAMADEVIAHLRLQLMDRSEAAHAGVDPERLATVDGLALDASTPRGAGGSVDAEDLALLFEVQRRRTGRLASRRGNFPRAAHLVVDEAQELAPMELALLRGAASERSLTITGDAAQQVDEGAGFAGWDASLAELGAADADRVLLTTTYRCPREVALFAHRLLGPYAPPSPPETARAGAPVLVSTAPTLAQAAILIADGLTRIVRERRSARVAVICRNAERAALFHRVLAPAVQARLVTEGEFGIEAGVEVTEVAEVRGLEFDLVVVPDISVQAWPDTPGDRRALHLAATRAAQQLWVVGAGTPPPAFHDAADDPELVRWWPA